MSNAHLTPDKGFLPGFNSKEKLIKSKFTSISMKLKIHGMIQGDKYTIKVLEKGKYVAYHGTIINDPKINDQEIFLENTILLDPDKLQDRIHKRLKKGQPVGFKVISIRDIVVSSKFSNQKT